jgi:hypothetical protein
MTALLSCLSCHERVAHPRGVCPRCNVRHQNTIARSEKTWAAHEVAGLSLLV